ncbi:MAG: permease [Candidatus Micrarchaeota archaeon]|nr:permease [Candidatus Micrarchaeota archaeon]
MENDKIILVAIVAVFLLFYFLPANSVLFNGSIDSGLNLLGDYAKQHILTCLVPALFIAGGITVFIQKEKILKYLGRDSNKAVAYGVASITGVVLAVCSCTILPLFAGIRKRGAGLGPAITFLFAGPAINIAAIFLTFSVLGYEIGLARAVASIVISIIVGLTMAFIFRENGNEGNMVLEKQKDDSPSAKTLALFFGLMVGVLVINGFQMDAITKYSLMALFAIGVMATVLLKFKKEMTRKWLEETWSFSKAILPLLFIGVFIAGFVMPLIPQEFIENVVGSNSIQGNLLASIFGAFMYFSTLTEIPILQVLISKGMASGPALALLLSGPSLSLPSMLVIRGILGTKKTAAYVALVILYSTIAGLIFGSLV